MFKATIPVDQCRTPFIHAPIWPEHVERYRTMIRAGAKLEPVLAYGLRLRTTTSDFSPNEFSLHDGNHRVAACRLEGVEQVEAEVICLHCFRTHRPCEQQGCQFARSVLVD